MARTLCLSAVIELPADHFEAAALTFKLSDPWLALCQALRETGAKHETKTDELETRTKPGRKAKPRLVTPPEAA